MKAPRAIASTIKRFGIIVRFEREQASWDAPDTAETDTTAYGVFTPKAGGAMGTEYKRRGSFTIAADTFVPRVGDRLFDGSETWNVIDVQANSLGSTTWTYDVEVGQ